VRSASAESAFGVFGFRHGIDEALSAAAQNGFADGKSSLGCSRRFRFPDGMTLVALALRGFLLRDGHLGLITAKQQ